MKDEENKIDGSMEELLKRAVSTPSDDSSAKQREVGVGVSAKEQQTKKKLNKTQSKNESEKPAKDERAKKAFKRLTGWDDDESVSVSLRTIIGGDILAGRWFREHLTFLLFLVFLAILYVTNRYAYQKEMIDNRKLTLALEDRRLRAVVATSNLTEYTRRSNISTQLTDSTLKSSATPFYYLQTK